MKSCSLAGGNSSSIFSRGSLASKMPARSYRSRCPSHRGRCKSRAVRPTICVHPVSRNPEMLKHQPHVAGKEFTVSFFNEAILLLPSVKTENLGSFFDSRIDDGDDFEIVLCKIINQFFHIWKTLFRSRRILDIHPCSQYRERWCLQGIERARNSRATPRTVFSSG